MSSILIKNGTIVNSENTFKSDLLIENGKIILIAQNIDNKADKEINANDFYVFPGAIDPHVHMYLPTPAGYSADDFYIGTKAALIGGTTTIIDFVTPKKTETLKKALNTRKKEAENSLIDFSFHVSPVKWDENTEKEISEIVDEGINSFKVYMAYKEAIGLNDSDLYNVMKAVKKSGGILTVHAELGDEIDELRNSYASKGNIEPKYHMLSRPNKMEAGAVKKIIEFADELNCPLYIVHVSAKESISYILKAQKKGQKVFAETCPHYLLLNDSKYEGDFDNVAAYILSPPLRKKEDNEILWQSIVDEVITTVGTDHCPFNLEQKKHGISDFRKIPNGAGGVEHRLSLLYTYGVLANKISLNKFADIISTNAAKIFGLYPQKGKIAVGSDADIVIWNPEKENIISAKTHIQNTDLNIFDGVKTKGSVEYVIFKGEIAVENEKIVKHTKGEFLKREKFNF
ncbi:MAG: dihydropyrimidinase [Bacteroidales bacterium]|nr:dihydropyrimidinase [Bacteroidales bacterium]MBN2758203.1 dihydropyrimidinase [Bacteroidales bacterium]